MAAFRVPPGPLSWLEPEAAPHLCPERELRVDQLLVSLRQLAAVFAEPHLEQVDAALQLLLPHPPPQNNASLLSGDRARV